MVKPINAAPRLITKKPETLAGLARLLSRDSAKGCYGES